MKYYNHHCHTHFSTLDAVTNIKDLVTIAEKRGHESATVTDHGTLAASYRLWKKCKAEGIKPVIGCEFYWVESYGGEGSDVPYNYGHITVLAKDKTGWKNLKKLQQTAWEDGFFIKPRVQLKDLIKYNEGLIITTGCINGILGRYYGKTHPIHKSKPLKKRKKLVYKIVRRLKKAFGDRLYVEIQLLDLEDQNKLNKFAIKVAKKFKLKVIPTQDSHYIKAEDSLLHDVVICMLWHSQLDDPDNHTYPTKQLWMKTYEELEESRKKWYPWISKGDLKRYCKNTERLQERVEEFNIIPEGSPLPVISDTPDKDLMEVCKGHPEYSNLMKKKAYKDRFKKEYEVITSLGFSNYFLVVWDIANHCRDTGIPYNARGSVNGSLIAFLMTITWVDPVEFDCPFERFLTEDRLSLPDIDMDMGRRRRAEVIQYVREKYGEDCVAHICNYTKLKPKNSIKDVAKILGYEFKEINAITTRIKDADMAIAPNSDYSDYYDKWENLNEYPKVKKFLEDNEDLSELAERMLSVNRQKGIHASGVVVTPTPISDWCPITYSLDNKRGANKGKVERLTEWDMYSLEDAGILKLDFLGQNTLDIIAYAIKLISKRHEVPYKNFDELCMFILKHLDDEKSYELICQGKNVGMFQLGTSKGMVELSKDMVPSSLDDITAIISLHRTAILKENMHTEFVKRRFGKDYNYVHPAMAKVLDHTEGILLYQEQTSGLAMELAGFTATEADHFRKGIKLKDKRKIAPWKKKFVKGCKKKSGMDRDDALEVWKYIEAFSGYGFNRAHGVAYALVAYITAYLKANYPYEFMTSLVSHNTDDDKKLKIYLGEVKKMGLRIYSPSINRSTRNFKLLKKGMLYPLDAVKQVGPKAIQSILKARRKGGKFKSLKDFMERVDRRSVNVRVVQQLILANAFRKFGKRAKVYDRFVKGFTDDKDIKQMYCTECEKRYPISTTVKKHESEGTVCPVCGSVSVSVSYNTCKNKQFNRSYIESEVYGYILGSSKLKAFTDILAQEDAQPLNVIPELNEGTMINVGFEVIKAKSHIDKNGNEMAFLDITDGADDTSVVVFASDWKKLKPHVKKGGCYLAKLMVNRGKLLFSSRRYNKSTISQLVKTNN